MINESIVKKFSQKNDKESEYTKEKYYRSSDDWQTRKSAKSVACDDGKKTERNAFGPMFKDRDHFNSMHFA